MESMDMNAEALTRAELINYLRIALNLQNIGIDNRTADQILTTYNKLKELGGSFAISDAVKIQVDIESRYSTKEDKK